MDSAGSAEEMNDKSRGRRAERMVRALGYFWGGSRLIGEN